eukprot:g3193.t1
MSEKEGGFATRAVHVAQAPDASSGAVVTPIVTATTFAQSVPGEPPGKGNGLSYGKGFCYARGNNPTRAAVEQCIASLEGAEHGVAFASGLAAVTAVFELLPMGAKVLCTRDAYGGTLRYLRAYGSNKLNIIYADLFSEPEEVLSQHEDIALVYIETPSNPLLNITDIARCVEAVRGKNTLIAADNTFASPFFQRPLALGADIVVEACTKYIGGHSDVVGGIVCVNRLDLCEKLRFYQNAVGSVPSPFDCYLLLRSIKTLALRMAQHERNAFAVAQFLEADPRIVWLSYPGLPSHPHHATAAKQMHGYSGMLSFIIRQDGDVNVFLSALKIFCIAESLGAVESLIEVPSVMTHASVPREERLKMGLQDNLVRASIGVEDAEDLISDLDEALTACFHS